MKLLCKCGKPIVKSNKYGMFCEDECELEESKKALEICSALINALEKQSEGNSNGRIGRSFKSTGS